MAKFENSMSERLPRHRSRFVECIKALNEHQSMSQLYQVLVDIRKNVDVDHVGYKQNVTKLNKWGALKKIVRIQNSLKKGIVGVTLSILGNCALQPQCATDLVCQYHILASLQNVIGQFEQEDSVNGRIFRIIGNLCQHRDNWARVIVDKHPQLVEHLIKILQNVDLDSIDQNQVSLATITMALRALRLLAKKSTISDLVGKFNVLKTVGGLLNIFTSQWEKDESFKSTLSNIIRVLSEYASLMNYQSIAQLRNTEHGDGLVSLVKIFELAPKKIIKMFNTFVQISQLKSDLPISELFDAFAEKLEDFHGLNSESEEWLVCLCQFLEHPVTRANDRCRNCIVLIVNILDRLQLNLSDPKSIYFCGLLLTTLDKCKYNENLMIAQLEADVINVLKRELHIIEDNCFSEKDENESDDYTIPASLDDHTYILPTASTSDSEMALSSTSGLSPRSQTFADLSDAASSDSDDYSPVCSEADPDENPNQEGDEADGSMPVDEDKAAEHHVENKCNDLRFQLNGIGLVVSIVNLLRTYVKLVPRQSQLGSYDLMQCLINLAIYHERWPAKVLKHIIITCSDILKVPANFLALMQTNLVSDLYSGKKNFKFEPYKGEIYTTLWDTAKSGFVFGELSHTLLRGTVEEKRNLVLAIPCLFSGHNNLSKLMVNCGGLDIFMDLLLTTATSPSKPEALPKIITILCVLASRLRISNPNDVDTIHTTHHLWQKSQLQSSNKSSDVGLDSVTFQLDDGTLVPANRTVLSAESDFFARLFDGGFVESRQHTIALHDVRNKSFVTLLQMRNVWNVPKSKMLNLDIDLETHLDVIALADRFLMMELCTFLTECLLKFKMKTKSIPTIYGWSVKSGTNLLRIEAVACALVSEVSKTEREQMFRELFALGCNEELVQDIKQLLHRYLSMGSFAIAISTSKEMRKRKRK